MLLVAHCDTTNSLRRCCNLGCTELRPPIYSAGRRFECRTGSCADPNLGERPIAFASRALNEAEQNCDAREQECLAIKRALDKFAPFIDGCKNATNSESPIWLIQQDHYTLQLHSPMKHKRRPTVATPISFLTPNGASWGKAARATAYKAGKSL